MKKTIHKKGVYSEWILPLKVYHGTTDLYRQSIMKDGLKMNHEKKNSALSLPLIYLTTSLEMAKGFAQSVAYKHGGKPIILEIDCATLEADSIGFDLNISLRLCSQCITYQQSLKVNNFMTHLDDILPASMIFNEPQVLTIPVVWDVKQEKTRAHLESIGYVMNKGNNEEAIQTTALKINSLKLR